MSIQLALNTPVSSDGITTEVTQSRDSKRYSVIVVGGRPSEKRDAAKDLFDLLGRPMNESPWAVTVAYGTGLLFGEAVAR